MNMRKHLNRKTYVFLIIALGVAIISAAVVYTFQQINQATSSEQKSEEAGLLTEQQQEAVNLAEKASQIAYSEGDSKKAVASLDQNIKSTDDNSQKSIYLSKKAEILHNSGEVDSAYEAAVEAHRVEPAAYGLAAYAGELAREKGDRDTAIKYYETALNLIKEDEPLAGEDAAYYRAVIDDLKAGR